MSARVLITGAANGIGAADVQELRSRGAHVVGLDLNGDGSDVIACDVREQAAIDSAVAQAIERLGGGLDVLINNAGIGIPQSAGKAPDDEAVSVFEVNMLGPWRVTSAALPALRESRGRVVNVASGLANMAIPMGTAYCMSKRGLVAYSDALRLEHGDAISVTTVYPGFIPTPIHDRSNEGGLPLEGALPAETVEDAAMALVRAALGRRPVRDLATTRKGGVEYALLRLTPRRLMDRVITAQMRRLARKGHFSEDGVGADLVRRLRRSQAG